MYASRATARCHMQHSASDRCRPREIVTVTASRRQSVYVTNKHYWPGHATVVCNSLWACVLTAYVVFEPLA